MDHRGHPKKPLNRNEIPLERLTEEFLSCTAEEEPSRSKQLEPLDAEGKKELAGILGRFDFRKRGALDPQQRLFARRILLRLQRPNTPSLTLTNKLLDYLDLNNNAILEENELEFALDLFALFARADSENDTLSLLELEMFYAVLRYIDSNHNGKLDPHEKDRLLQGLQQGEAFLSEQKAQNPLLQKVLSQHHRS